MADETPKHEMQPADAPTWQIDIAEGAEVFTSDGEKLGTIKEIGIGYFKLDVRKKASEAVRNACSGGRRPLRCNDFRKPPWSTAASRRRWVAMTLRST